MIPAGLPIILETPVAPEQMQDEIDKANFALALVADARLATYS
jgi:hypothetical protein